MNLAQVLLTPIKPQLYMATLRVKNQVFKCSHIIYQAIANFIYFLKNIKTIWSKLTKKPPQVKIAGAPYSAKKLGFPNDVSIDCKFYVPSEKCKSHMLEIHKNPPLPLLGQHKLP